MKLAFIFPGQGSQKVGMLARLATAHSTILDTFAEASEILGYDLWSLIQEGPQSQLDITERTQPMILTASVALWRLWLSHQGPMPSCLAGHSLGEWSALVCAEAVTFADAVKAVQLRGHYMQEELPTGEGTMAAIIGLDDTTVIQLCKQATQRQQVAAVNFNSPGQVVIAGHTAAVHRACELCRRRGAKRAQVLPVSAPFHSTLLKPAADKLAEYLQRVTFLSPKIPIVHNVHAQTEADPVVIKKRVLEQIYHPVRWIDCINQLLSSGVTQTVECGPGRVLSGLNKRINRSLLSHCLETPEYFAAAQEALNRQECLHEFCQ